MKFNFDTTLNHRNNGSYRWDIPGTPDDMIGMGTADLDYSCPPCVKEALLSVAEENCYNYRQRPDEYFNAIINWYEKKYSLKIEKEWLSTVPSTIGAIRMALEIWAKPGDAIICQTPLFAPITRAVLGADCKIIDNPMIIVDGHYEINFEDFEKKIAEHKPALYLMVNPHNPTGRVYTQNELEKLVDICDKYGVKIVSDEVHSLILYGENRHTPILAVNETARRISVQIMSLSKGYNIMSLPHAIVTIANEDMQKEWMRQITAFSFGYATNSFAIAAVTSIFKGGADEWMKELTCYLNNNLLETLSFLKAHDIPLIPFLPEGGFLLWLDCRKAGIGTENLDKFFLEKAHIHLDDGEENFGPEGKGFVRINYAVTNSVLKEALERIRAAFDK